MKKMFLLSVMSLMLVGVCASAGDAVSIEYPGVKNGDRFLIDANGASYYTPAGYDRMVMRCTFNYTGCTYGDAMDYFSASSSKDGVCRRLGYDRAISSDESKRVNAYGLTAIVNEDGDIQDYLAKKKIRLPARAVSADSTRTWVYDDNKEKIITRITCIPKE